MLPSKEVNAMSIAATADIRMPTSPMYMVAAFRISSGQAPLAEVFVLGPALLSARQSSKYRKSLEVPVNEHAP